MFSSSSSSSHHHQMYNPYNLSRPAPVDRRWRPGVETAPNCPRCDSSNTKFCYYNNYSLTQPRYFCKGCRRYWTKGGSLRNVPVGGGCRKNRRSKPLRPPPVTAGSASRPPPSTGLRPDLALDDMVGGGSCRDDTDGSDIDLAMLYSKFLNNTDQGVVAHDEAGPSLGSDQIGQYFEYGFDPSGFESSHLGLDPLVDLGPPEPHHHHHQDMFVGDWCSSLDQSSFGAF